VKDSLIIDRLQSKIYFLPLKPNLRCLPLV